MIGLMSKKARLITNDLELGKGPAAVVAALSSQTGWKKIEEAVDRLWRAFALPREMSTPAPAARSLGAVEMLGSQNPHGCMQVR